MGGGLVKRRDTVYPKMGEGRGYSVSGSNIELFQVFRMRVKWRNAKIFSSEEREAKFGMRERKP